MSTLLSAKEIKDKISLVDLLARLGFQPAKPHGKELFYLSMLRDEKTPSFCVNEELGVWYDHGGANDSGIKGGNVIDFGLAYWHPVSFREVLEKISLVCDGDYPFVEQHKSARTERPKMSTKQPSYQIGEIKALGHNFSITKYLQARGIWCVSQDLLKEIYYTVEHRDKTIRPYYGAGWSNENGGWEISNPVFKGCLGPKGMTVIPGEQNCIAIFEGMMDYLSWKYENEEAEDTILILNTLSFLEAAVKRSSGFNQKSIYFDHDQAGASATRQFLQAYPDAVNGNSNYEGYKDYNEKHIAEIKVLEMAKAKPATEFFAGVKVRFSR